MSTTSEHRPDDSTQVVRVAPDDRRAPAARDRAMDVCRSDPACPGALDAATLASLPLAPSRVARIGWVVLGGLCVAVGAVGVVVPGLPTTPFLVLAAACFVRGSPRLYARLLAHRRFGPLVANYRAGRGVPRRVKFTALSLMTVFVTLAVGPGLPDGAFVPRIVVLVAAVVGALYVTALPNTEDFADLEDDERLRGDERGPSGRTDAEGATPDNAPETAPAQER